MTVADFLSSARPVTLGDRELILGYLKRFPHTVCELSLTNFFLWGKSRRHLFLEKDGHLIVSFQKDDEDRKFYVPIGPDPVRMITEVMKPSDGFLYEYVDESLAEKLKDKANLVADPDRSDYIYALKNLRELPGDKYSQKRNYIKRCRELGPEIVRLSSAMKAECTAIDERWLGTQPKPWPVSVTDEISAFALAMEHFEDLGLHGVGIRIAGRLEALAIGAPLNGEMFLQTIQKANRDIKGLYQLMFHEFAMSVPEPFTLLNLEEDMGLPALRAAKEGWNPVFLVKKYKILA